eukprot:Protomagalhaensia_wolfi_Nauph_80__3800@NODE_384_length_2633_cov_84_411719_g290_i0_p1_GENE_NODE_384_length_2633_cov_84_411719_g290_i0NODE_384_length_2633_cov_84_411719_g290_i0_p1_ORF_typecomplete_len322_score48_33Pkinase/PF00069_25/4_6e70Pkinase_Tyr/PF07714_17/3_4e44Kinaselike/PF14531_6/1_1e16Pkinase_fungal/PF17667_1/2_3e09Kdo/PF06293_14/3_5e09RIO1/PF01163_22/8_7e05WaaY/PF06176_11/0_00028APH/PF01636_23/0_00056Haspin_kinase/PF12330_8/0_037Seadorna_VP7/PF07387_11/0_037Pox_serthr_kin/PF05445_11/0_09
MEAVPESGPRRYKQIDSHIGQGAYGKVEKALDLRTGEYVAIKKVRVEAAAYDDNSLKDAGYVIMNGINHTVWREIKVMQEVNHPNVITLYDVFVDGDFINLVMPLMESDLHKLLEKRIRLNDSQLKCIMKQVLEGVAELHRNWFLHRDLSPGNIFINDQGVCKVADFGLVRTFGSPRPTKKTSMVVTLWYRSPELLYGSNYYQDKVDVWSIGCVMAEFLLGGKPLFPGTSEVDQLAKIFAVCGSPSVLDKSAPDYEQKLSTALWPDAKELPLFFEFTHREPQPWASIMPMVSATALDLLEKMLQLDPNKRITCEEVSEFGQ